MLKSLMTNVAICDGCGEMVTTLQLNVAEDYSMLCNRCFYGSRPRRGSD